ncbi:30S ribosomal protein S19 [Candidatus Woesearchaeota archaeon]|nr:30S ribosomal protein S19 [Candidatus Woesearchaeota archaeon]
MARKEYTYRGKSIEQLKAMDIKEFTELLPARQRRSLLRGFSEDQKILLLKIKKAKDGKFKKNIRTHCRDMIVIPEMIGVMIYIHNGKAFVPVDLLPDTLGFYLGELAMTRSRVAHSSPGIGASKSSAGSSKK